MDQPVALEERSKLGKAGLAVGSTEVVHQKRAEV